VTGTHAHTCVEVGRLNGEIESLRRDNLAMANENARLRQQRDAFVAVVEAAKVWRAQFEKPADTKLPRMAALIAAVDALPTAVNV
jgi:hypothetical protein